MRVKKIDQNLLEIVKKEKVNITLKAVFDNSCYGFYHEELITLLPDQKALLPNSITIQGEWKSFLFILDKCYPLAMKMMIPLD